LAEHAQLQRLFAAQSRQDVVALILEKRADHFDVDLFVVDDHDQRSTALPAGRYRCVYPGNEPHRTRRMVPSTIPSEELESARNNRYRRGNRMVRPVSGPYIAH